MYDLPALAKVCLIVPAPHLNSIAKCCQVLLKLLVYASMSITKQLLARSCTAEHVNNVVQLILQILFCDYVALGLACGVSSRRASPTDWGTFFAQGHCKASVPHGTFLLTFVLRLMSCQTTP